MVGGALENVDAEIAQGFTDAGDLGLAAGPVFYFAGMDAGAGMKERAAAAYRAQMNLSAVSDEEAAAVRALYARSAFRSTALSQAVARAEVNAAGRLICPTCRQEIPERLVIQTKNGPVIRRGFDLDHYPETWGERIAKMKNAPVPPARNEVLDAFNQDLRVQCPTCNQSHRFEGLPGPNP
jgi:hypothetical protein